MLAADSDTVAPSARVGFGRLVDEAWRRLDQRIRSADGVVFLYDATPLARYIGGDELLARLVSAARQADEAPHGLWLLCPMRQDLQLRPRSTGLRSASFPAISSNSSCRPPSSESRIKESVMIDRTALLRDLKAQVRLLEEDIRQRSADVPEFDGVTAAWNGRTPEIQAVPRATYETLAR